MFCREEELDTQTLGYSLSACYWFTVDDKFPAITDTPKAMGESHDVLSTKLTTPVLPMKKQYSRRLHHDRGSKQ